MLKGVRRDKRGRGDGVTLIRAGSIFDKVASFIQLDAITMSVGFALI